MLLSLFRTGRWTAGIALSLSASLSCLQATADTLESDSRLMAQIGPYVMHWYESEDRRNDWPALVGLEWEDSARWEVGGAVFRNSFFQSSVYIYGGRRWFLPELSDWRSLPSNLYIKLTGGPLYGYRGDYKDKVPFNHKGLGVAILPALGYQHQNANVQAVFLGTAAVIFTLGYDFY